MKKAYRAIAALSALTVCMVGCVETEPQQKPQPPAPDGKSYTLTLIDGNDLISADSFVSGTPITLPQLEGVTGWSTPYPATMPNNDLALRAVRESKPKALPLSFKDISAGVLPYKTSVSLPAFEVGSHESASWWKTADGAEVSSPYEPTENDRLIFSSQAKEYTVTYRLNANAVGVQTYEAGERITPLAEPAVSDGKVFGGWTTLPEIMPAKDVTVIGYEEQSHTVDLSALTDGETYTITQGGCWELSGTAKNASIVVNAPNQNVTIVLNGVSLTCSFASAPISCEKASSLNIVLAEGTTNTVSDGSLNPLDAAITVKNADDCVFSGKGSLSVTSAKSAVYHSKSLFFYGGSYRFRGESGAEGKQSLTVAGGSFDVEASKWAFKTGDDKGVNTMEGSATFTGGTVTARTQTKGLNVYGSLDVWGADITVHANGTGDAINVSGAAAIKNAKLDLTTSNQDGLQADASLVIEDSEVKINAGQDAVKSDGTISVVRSSLALTGSEDGIDGTKKVEMSVSELQLDVKEDGVKGGEVALAFVTIVGEVNGDGVKANATGKTLSVSNARIELACGGDGFSSDDKISVKDSFVDLDAGKKGETTATGALRSRVGIKANGSFSAEGAVFSVQTPDTCVQSAAFSSQNAFYTLTGSICSDKTPTGSGNAFVCASPQK